jgi:uncharacterized protein (TIGR02145 family)
MKNFTSISLLIFLFGFINSYSQEIKKPVEQKTTYKIQKPKSVVKPAVQLSDSTDKTQAQVPMKNFQTKKIKKLDIPEVVTDYDGNVYKTVKIGDQVWMAENLKTTHYSDGTEITEGIYTYSNNIHEAQGKHYNWYTAMNKTQGVYNMTPNGNHQGVCPEGWHIPSKQELEYLVNFNGGPQEAGAKLKEAGTEHWKAPNEGATNESGFTALPAGWAYEGGGSNLGNTAVIWSKTSAGGPSVDSGIKAWKLILNYNNTVAWISSTEKVSNYSVRCLKD